MGIFTTNQDPNEYEQELLDMGADPEDANAAKQAMIRDQRDRA